MCYVYRILISLTIFPRKASFFEFLELTILTIYIMKYSIFSR